MCQSIGEPVIPLLRLLYYSVEEAIAAANEIGYYPVVLRPAFTLGAQQRPASHNEA
ncbi:ATP-binding protein [Anaerotignum faecicola]|uniref:Carbamoyl phosphate synthase ATP-binding domain-containing protein n=1 Tax=Anaerotignum faecicola TaxID=2358141 RepID=A0A401LF97_9FIRM|nr:hypothetical protein KGMB03357_18810 [Anaerotignum faecicola]